MLRERGQRPRGPQKAANPATLPGAGSKITGTLPRQSRPRNSPPEAEFRAPGSPAQSAPGNSATKAGSEILGSSEIPEGANPPTFRWRAGSGIRGAEQTPQRTARPAGSETSPSERSADTASATASLPNPGPAWLAQVVARPGRRDFTPKSSGLNPGPGRPLSPARPSRAASRRSGCTSCTGSPATCRSACGP